MQEGASARAVASNKLSSETHYEWSGRDTKAGWGVLAARVFRFVIRLAPGHNVSSAGLTACLRVCTNRSFREHYWQSVISLRGRFVRLKRVNEIVFPATRLAPPLVFPRASLTPTHNERPPLSRTSPFLRSIHKQIAVLFASHSHYSGCWTCFRSCLLPRFVTRTSCILSCIVQSCWW